MGRREGQGDDARLAEWVRLYADSLRGYLWTLLDDKSVVEDLLQEVFLRAWRTREAYVDLGREKAYLFRIADRLLQDRARSKRMTANWRSALDIVDGRQPEPHTSLEYDEDKQLLAEAIESLSESQRRAILLRYFGDLDFERIAEILACPRNTALSHVHRGLQRLKALLLREVSQ